MSYKLNKKIPGRKFELDMRRQKQRNAVATTHDRKVFRWMINTETMQPELVRRNKYIISGPNCNIAEPRDVIWE